MNSSPKIFVVFLYLGSIIFSTTAQNNLELLASKKIGNILSYADGIFKIIQTTNNEDINIMGDFIASIKRGDLNIKNLENLRPEIINKIECLWKSGWSGNYSHMLQEILIKSNENYIEFENYLINKEYDEIINPNFVEFADTIITSYIRDQVFHGYVKFVNRTMPALRNGLFDVLARDFDPENNCNVESVDELFTDMAALYSLVFTKQYTMILVSLKTMQVPALRNEMRSIKIYNEYLNRNPIVTYQDLLAEARGYYKEAIYTTYESVIKAFIK
ncbi:hypothetical protein PV326_008283 [Microctonus aethiopoides]|nr:hypothetical protein PV326_008283 [Microctonus aethiopoides]